MPSHGQVAVYNGSAECQSLNCLHSEVYAVRQRFLAMSDYPMNERQRQEAEANRASIRHNDEVLDFLNRWTPTFSISPDIDSHTVLPKIVRWSTDIASLKL